MATRTESLVGKLSIHDAEWKAGLAKAASQFRAFSGQMGKTLAAGLGSARGAISGLGGMLTGAFSGITSAISGIAQVLGVGGLLSGAGIVAGIKSVADLGGELSDVSARTGMLVKDLVVLREQFRQGGLDAGSVTQYVRRMNESLMDGKKADLFKALKLDAKALLNAGPVAALDAILTRVRQLKNTAAQQKALSQIFGGRQGIQLMTLVEDPKSSANAKKMVGGMAGLMNQIAADLDAISDNLFGGIPVKIQQLFTGFTASLIPPLKKVMDMVVGADFTGVGQKLGAQLMWAAGVFKGLWENGDLWNFAAVKLQQAFYWAASYFAGVMSAAWQAIFSEENLMVVKNLFQGLGMMLAGEIQAALPGILGGSKSEGESKKRSGGMILDNTVGFAGDAAAITGKRFAESVANIQALPVFANQLRDLANQSSGLIYDAARTGKVGARSPISSASDLRPAAAPSPLFSMSDAELRKALNGGNPQQANPLGKGEIQAALKFLGAIAANTEVEVE